MKKLIACLCLFLMFFSAASTVQAADVWQMAESKAYGQKAGGMLGRGLINASTCFVDILVQTVDGTKNGPPFIGSLMGLGSGIGCTSLRAISGVLDVATFWVPGFNGFPVCKDYSNCLCAQLRKKAEAAPVEQIQAAPAPVTYVAPAPQAVEPSAPKKQSPMKYVKK